MQPIDFCCTIAMPLTLKFLVGGNRERLGHNLVHGSIRARDRLLDSLIEELAVSGWKSGLQITKALPSLAPMVSRFRKVDNGHGTRPCKQVPA